MDCVIVREIDGNEKDYWDGDRRLSSGGLYQPCLGDDLHESGTLIPAAPSEGPITDPMDLAPALRRALEVVRRGEPALVDVVTQPR